MGLTCTLCQETCRNRADYVTHIKQHIEAGEKMGSDGLPGDKEIMDTEEDEDEEEEPFTDGDDEYQPPSYVVKKIPKLSKSVESEEDMGMIVDKEEADQVVYVRNKDGHVVKKTIKTLMPIQRQQSQQQKPTGAKPQLKAEDETEAQVNYYYFCSF